MYLNKKSFFLFSILSLCSSASLAGDVTNGKEVFKLCQGCHSPEPDIHLFGPSLSGIFNRDAGQLESYDFSDALMAANFKWDEDHLTEWLQGEPKNMVPGTYMEWPGMANDSELEDLISYLKTL